MVVQLTVAGAARAVDFYREVFGADELYRNAEAGGDRLVHCELLICGARVVVHDEFPEFGLLGPASVGGASASLNLYVPDADAIYERALARGGRGVSAPSLHFWGARSGSFLDPFGHRWIVSTQLEDLSPDEIIERSRRLEQQPRLSAAAPGRSGKA